MSYMLILEQIATVFAGPAAGQAYYYHSTWRWAYGTFAIITPAISLPFLWVFWNNQRLAKRQGVLVEKREASGRRLWDSVQHYLIEFDGQSIHTSSRDKLTVSFSYRPDLDNRRMGTGTLTIQSRDLRGFRMEICVNHRHACRWFLLPHSFHHPRALLRKEIISTFPPSHGPDRNRVVSHSCLALPQFLPLGPLFHIFPSSSLRS